jgi:ATP-binding protein involved in chromosome partitioning
MRKIRTYAEVDHATGSELLEQVVEQHARLGARLEQVGAVVAVLSGKGGVGKSLVTAGIGSILARQGSRVGVVDADLNGPSMTRMLGCEGARLGDGPGGVVPATGNGGVRVIGMDLLQHEADAPLRWREPEGHASLWQSSVETAALREFLGDVDWGRLDVLLVDVPPGTDKIRRLLELVPGLSAAVVVTTPGEMSRSVVARSIRLVLDAGIPVVGLVSNMSGYRCPGCDEVHALFPGNAPEALSERFGVPIWGAVPLDPELGRGMDRGDAPDLAATSSPTAAALAEVAARLMTALADHEGRTR